MTIIQRNIHVMVLRQIIECSSISPASKGYYTMYVSGCIDWDDIPKENADEIDGVFLVEEVE
jgi:hypothetical protein